jgi:hypothetical protein
LLKNIIIIILLLVNGFLLGALAIRQRAEYTAQHRTEEQLAALFAADGMTLDSDAISRESPPASLTLSQDAALERELAAFFLGKSLVQDGQSGDSYTSHTGVARFRSNGSFEVAGSLSMGGVEDFCRKFCKEFSYDEPVFSLDSDGSGTGTALRRYGKLPVYNCAVTFTVDHGTLMTVRGTLLSDTGATAAEDQEPLSAAAALTAFLQARRESAAVVTSITDMYPCYEMQSAPLALTPTWCVVTDTASYYVNCVTGAVVSG